VWLTERNRKEGRSSQRGRERAGRSAGQNLVQEGEKGKKVEYEREHIKPRLTPNSHKGGNRLAPVTKGGVGKKEKQRADSNVERGGRTEKVSISTFGGTASTQKQDILWRKRKKRNQRATSPQVNTGWDKTE